MDDAPALGVAWAKRGVAALAGNPAVATLAVLIKRLFEVGEIAELRFGICELAMLVALANNGETVDDTIELELVGNTF